MSAARSILGANRDQEFPQWILSSLTETPDRVQYILHNGPDALTGVVNSFKVLEDSLDGNGNLVKRADFAVMACITAHKLIPEIKKQVKIEIVSIVEETIKDIALKMPNSRIGILATTATIQTNLFQKECQRHGITAITPLDLKNGDKIQKELVMDTIYGDWHNNDKSIGGIKGLGILPKHIDALQKASILMKEQFEIDAVIAGCTELDCALTMNEFSNITVIKPYKIIAEYIINRIYK